MTINALIKLLTKYAASDCEVLILRVNEDAEEYLERIEGLRVVVDAEGVITSVVLR